METLELTVTVKIESGTEPSDIEEVCYSVKLKIPHKSKLTEILPNHMDRASHSFKFYTGPLARVKHGIIMYLLRRHSNGPSVAIFTYVEEDPNIKVTFKTVTTPETGLLNEEEEHFIHGWERDPPEIFSKDPILLEWYGCGNNDNFTKRYWEFDVNCDPGESIIFPVTFHVDRRKVPKIINPKEEPLMSGNTIREGSLNMNIASPFFLSPQFSDFTFLCGSESFPTHRIILASRVKYFERMFASDMNETKEGTITIEDMSPSTLKELLRFIYHCQLDIDSLEEPVVTELFIASDKYGMDDLKSLCEKKMYKSLDVDAQNAIEIYDLGKTYGSSLLAEKAVKVILSNRHHFAPDAETLKKFTIKYPDLVFQLFTMA